MLYTSQSLCEDSRQVILSELEYNVFCLHESCPEIQATFPDPEQDYDPNEIADFFFQTYNPVKVIRLYNNRDMILYRDRHGRFLTKENGILYISGSYKVLIKRHIGWGEEYVVQIGEESQLIPLVSLNSLLADEDMSRKLWALEEQEGRIFTKTMKQAEVQRILKLQNRGFLKKDFGIEITHQSRDQIIDSLL